MTSKTLTITNAQGFHMRPAGAFAAAMAKFNSNVTIKFNGSDVNGKSLMNIIAAGIKCGSTIEIVCEGDDENAALDSAVALVESGFVE